VFFDSIDRRYAGQGEFVNCGLYTRKAVVQWLNVHCFHLQDGVVRAAFVWAVSSQRLPPVHADLPAPLAAPPTHPGAGASTTTESTSTSAGTSTSTSTSSAGTSTTTVNKGELRATGEDGGARKVARIL
jgi:hypothetical protein